MKVQNLEEALYLNRNCLLWSLVCMYVSILGVCGVIHCIFKWVTIKEHLRKVQLLCYVMPSRNDYVWHKLKSMAIYNASSILCITFPFLLFNHPSSSSFNTLPVFLLSPFCPLIHSPILFFLCCLYCSIPFSFQEPIHPCITHSVTCWWITVDVLSLTWWEISVTFSKGHHMNTQQTDALCPVPCTLACTHKGTHFHLTLSSGANEGTVKDLYTFPCLSFCSCLPSRFFSELQKETFPSSTHPLYSFQFNYSLWFLPLHFFSEACWNSPPFCSPRFLFSLFCCWYLCCLDRFASVKRCMHQKAYAVPIHCVCM